MVLFNNSFSKHLYEMKKFYYIILKLLKNKILIYFSTLFTWVSRVLNCCAASVKSYISHYYITLFNKYSRFHFAVRVYCNRSRTMS